MIKSITGLTIGIDNIRRALALLKEGKIEDASSLIEDAATLLTGMEAAVFSNTSPVSDLLSEIEEQTERRDWSRLYREGKTRHELEPGMLTGNSEVRFLAMMIKLAGYKRVLEIGSFTGYATLGMAEALPDGGKIVACEQEEYVANMARSFFRRTPHDRKTTIRVGPALESMRTLSDEGWRFDLVFMDADKLEYRDYLNAILELSLLSPGGCIVVDNTLYRGEISLPPERRSKAGEAIREFNRMVMKHPKLEHVMLPLRDGVTVIKYT
uniref:Caffeoyl-CoA O-methyltransferase n=1 Tax=Candidatus Kentrum sp. TC TaxID=2126339 RepID=A0A450Z456_9GAMM|nr:MAG: caffeoyl-CoA O-methyltransferase [Candidatus Kentron sp. TC]